MNNEFINGMNKLKEIECPCTWEEFYNEAVEVLPGYVIIGDKNYFDAAYNEFYRVDITSYELELNNRDKIIGEDTIDFWIENNMIVKIK